MDNFCDVQKGVAGRTYGEHEADRHVNKDNPGEGSRANAKIKLVDLEQMNNLRVVDEAEHSGHDNGGQSNQRRVTKQRCQEQEC